MPRISASFPGDGGLVNCVLMAAREVSLTRIEHKAGLDSAVKQ